MTTTAMTKRENNALVHQPARSEVRSWASALLDVYENADELLVLADLPGVVPEAIRIEYREGELKIEASRDLENDNRWATDFRRALHVGSDVDADRISATLKDGVLELRLPKSEAAKPKQITVRRA